MKLSVAVMAHPKREAFIPSLLERLPPLTTVVWDTDDNRWSTGRASMLAHDPSADYHVVIQDDAIVCRDLIEGLTGALAFVPQGHPVGLYVGRQRPMRSRIEKVIQATEASGDSWVVYPGPLWGVGLAVPVPAIGDMLAVCDRMGVKNYDTRLYRYFNQRNLPCYYTHPSLVEHRESPSLVPGRMAPGRVAHRFIGADASALDIDWSKVPAEPTPLGTTMAARRRR